MANRSSGLFPYEPRAVQISIMDAIERSLRGSEHVVIEAGTGSGKTVSALSPSLEYCYTHGKRVLYLTRTNSQQKQVVEEFRMIRGRAGTIQKSPAVKHGFSDVVDEVMKEINDELRGDDPDDIPEESEGDPWEKGPANGICAALQGRNNMCPLASEEPEFITGTPEELSKMCSERKKNSCSRMMGKPTGGKECRFYSAFLMDDGMEMRGWASEINPTAEELLRECLRIGICPYEVNKAILPDAILVTAPYIYFISPFIRRRLLTWMDCSLDDLVVIVDEAHNLAQFAREISSLTLSTRTLHLALAEVESMGDHRVGKPYTIRNFLEVCLRAFGELSDEYLIEEDGLVPPSALAEELMVLLRTNSSRIDSMASEMLHHGQAIQDQKKAMGKLPRSYIHKVALFYRTWQEIEFESYSPLIVKGRREGEISLEAHSMDPSMITSVLLETHSSIHMSGTLSPLDEYRDTIGLPGNAPLVKLPPPFPLENRRIEYHQDLTTNYEVLSKDASMKMMFREAISKLLENARDSNTAIFFPSFDLMGEILGIEELEDGNRLPVYIGNEREFFIEKRGSSQTELMELATGFKESGGGVLVSVLGGRLSEGMDFPGRSLEVVYVVGIPYPKPTARQRALSAYYDIRFQKGWEYTVHAPAARKLLQAVGRMIRSANEKGYALLMDRRSKHFQSEFPDMVPFKGDFTIPKRFLEGKI